jgi:CDP-4-dehydro-6-deoxyglucose reductase
MAHRVTLKPSGHEFEAAEDKNVLQAGLDAGLAIPYSCRAGVCRTCRGLIKEGRVDYGNVSAAYLPETDKAQGYALLCQAKALTDIVVEVRELAGLAGIKPKIMPARVEAIARPAADVAVLTLRLPSNEKFKFVAGQYIDILLKGGKRRSYSIATQPTEEGVGALEIHVRHLPGGLYTDQVFSTLKPRDLIRLEGPLGTFSLREDSDKPIVLLASGTGFAPIKAMVEAGFSKNIFDRRPATLYWGCRAKRDLYMLDVAAAWSHPSFRFVPVLSDPTAECGWSGKVCFVHRAVLDDFPDLSGTQVYACGAPVMVEAARKDFIEQGKLPPDEFYADSFLTEADTSKA